LRRHVERCPHEGCHEIVLQVVKAFSEPEVSYLEEHLVVVLSEEDVSWFEIPMDDSSLEGLQDSPEYLYESG
jgi:hypothetical protein